MNKLVAKQWCQLKNDIPYFETSAKEGTNIDKAFHTIAKNALAHLYAQDTNNELMNEFPAPVNLNLITQDNQTPSTSRSCSC